MTEFESTAEDAAFLARPMEALDFRGQLEREIHRSEVATKTLRALSGPPGSDAPLIVYEEHRDG